MVHLAKPTKTGKPIRRIRHHQDERLLATDLNADMAYEAMLRRLHLRGLHDTWGVALGLRLVRGKDGKAALVTPGLAYDCLGRELLLPVGTALEAPTRPPEYAGLSLAYDLTVRYTLLQAQSSPQARADFCLQPPNQDLNFRWALAGALNHPAAAWLAESIRLGEEVPLGRFILDAKGTLSQPDYRFRRNARPLLRPHLALNSVLPAWQAKHEQVDESTNLLVCATFDASINTPEGGFSQDTHYFVRLLPSAGLAALLARGALLGPLTSVSNPSYSGFSVRVSFGLVNANQDQQLKLLSEIDTEMRATRLLWVGAEPVTGCTPSFSQIYSGYGHLVMVLNAQAMTALTYFGM
jgi:hypothetical protein